MHARYIFSKCYIEGIVLGGYKMHKTDSLSTRTSQLFSRGKKDSTSRFFHLRTIE